MALYWLKPPVPPIHALDQVQPRFRNNKLPFRAALVRCCVNPISKNFNHNSLGHRLQVMVPKTHPFEPTCWNIYWCDRSQVEISDRSFGPGSWVTRDGAVGQVQQVSVRADIQIIGTTVLALNVLADRLVLTEAFPEGSKILYDSWLGTVMRSERIVTVHIGKDQDEDPYVGVINIRFTEDVFRTEFKGDWLAFRRQKIKGPWHSLKDADWEVVNSGKERIIATEFEGRVAKVEVESLDLEWNKNIGEEGRPEPKAKLASDVLANIELIESSDVHSFRLGSVRYFEPSLDDDLVYAEKWLGRWCLEVPNISEYVGQSLGVQCLQTYTTVDVLWKDGSTGTFKGIDLEPYQATMKDFIRGDVVTGPGLQYGIVETAIHKTRKVHIRDAETRAQLTVDVSEIKICEGFQLYPGNVVLRSRPDIEGFICGWVTQCQNDGQITVKCRGTGEVKSMRICDLWCVFSDLRHQIAAPALFNSITREEKQSPKIQGRCHSSTSAAGPTPMEISSDISLPDHFVLRSVSPDLHYFVNETSMCTENADFVRTIHREMNRMQNELDCAFVIGYAERLDLYSVILVGPDKTPFQHNIFFFDMFLPSGFPAEPPKLFYKSIVDVPILPNIKEGRSFYVHELLGGTWNPNQRYGLTDILTCLQDSVFVCEPFFTTGTDDRRKALRGSQKGNINSRRMNERFITEFVKGTQKLLDFPVIVHEWQPELIQILKFYVPRMVDRVQSWTDGGRCEFPLQAVSPAFTHDMKNRLPAVLKTLAEITAETPI